MKGRPKMAGNKTVTLTTRKVEGLNEGPAENGRQPGGVNLWNQVQKCLNEGPAENGRQLEFIN